jgi:Fe-S-cluster-containing dehydrogenase component/formate-dependent nitrite reductase membrane component NrfD
MNFGFVIDNRKCIGCHACTVACKAEHEVPVGVNRTWVKYIEKGTFPDTRRLFSVMRCNHCADAPCVEICPVTALFTRKDGIVDFDTRRCIGCKACTQACPYDALYMHPDDHTSAKCNYCTHRVDIGLEPACVNVCPEHAIISGDMDNPETEISKLLARETVSVRKPEKGTNPKLFYIDGDRASLDPTEANPGTDYMWSSQSSGVGHQVGRTVSPSSSPNWRSVGSPKAGGLVQIEPREKGRTNSPSYARRVYDAPDKGVLWGWEVSAYVWTKAIAAGAYLMTFFFMQVQQTPILMKMVGAAISMIFLAITGALLVKDLGRPERFIYTLLRPQWRSWLTRGSYIITVFGAILTTWWVAFFLGAFTWLPMIEWLGVIPAALTAVYTAFLFAQAKGRDFWQSPVLGLHMLVHSVIAGAAALMISDVYFDWNQSFVGSIKSVAFLMLVVSLLLLTFELWTTHATDDAHAVAKMITRGQFSRAFWLGTIVVGHLVPMFLILRGGDGIAVVVAGVLILVGMYIAEHIWVKAPQLVPLS